MSLVDATAIPGGSTLEADVCVVGAGPAGVAVAAELDRAGVRTLLLESADRNGFGGTGNEWYGRLGLLDTQDFAPRPWVPLSGWPVPAAAVLDHASRASRFLGLARPDALHPATWASEPAFEALRTPLLAPGAHVWSRTAWSAGRHLAALRRSRQVQVVVRAHARGLVAEGGAARIASVAVEGPARHRFGARARAYVLACGGLENARVLLLSHDAEGRAAGNRHDAVGRHLMDHPRCEDVARLRLDPAHPRYAAHVRELTEHRDRRAGGRVQFWAGLDPALREREELLGVGSFLYVVTPPRVRRLGEALRSRRLADAGVVAAGLPLLARLAARRAAGRPLPVDHLVLIDQAEQAPDPARRVTLGDRRDRFGDPLLDVHWGVGDESTRALRRLHQLLAERFAATGIGRLESALVADPGHVPAYTDAAHPMGTTRMSADPRHGVVDSDCRVHGMTNLYVAGSSVFPTGGHAPPTLTIVCLALRLADHLRRELGAGLG